MKKLVWLICICSILACKKDIGDLGGETFVLRAATVSPAMMVNGKAETNYMTKSGASACLNYDYQITFKKEGTYATSSNGPLCDRAANSNTQKWTRDGDKVTLTDTYGPPIVANLKGDKLSYTGNFATGGITYEVVYQFESK